jgi:hypothetical protein
MPTGTRHVFSPIVLPYEPIPDPSLPAQTTRPVPTRLRTILRHRPFRARGTRCQKVATEIHNSARPAAETWPIRWRRCCRPAVHAHGFSPFLDSSRRRRRMHRVCAAGTRLRPRSLEHHLIRAPCYFTVHDLHPWLCASGKILTSDHNNFTPELLGRRVRIHDFGHISVPKVHNACLTRRDNFCDLEALLW